MKNFLTLILTTFLWSACEKTIEPKVIPPDYLIGSWINPIESDSSYTFTKANELKNQEYGITFNPAPSFIERKNVSWCATHPIYYGDFNGSWSKLGTTIDIKVPFWGSIAEYQWELVSVDQNTLTIHVLKEDYHR